MSTTKDLRLARSVKVLLDFIFGLLVFACIALVLWIAIAPWILGRGGIPGTASVAVTIGSGDEPQFAVTFAGSTTDEIRAAFVDTAEGTLRLETTSYFLLLITNAARLVAAVGLAYITYLLRAVVQAVLDGDPFAPENSRRIRQLGYAVLLVGILRTAVENLAAAEVLRRLPTTEPLLGPGPAFDVEVILVALLILLLAHIWSYGRELEREKALTI